MSRTRKTKKTKMDLSKPVDITKIPLKDEDCFGKEHDLRANECKMCHDSELCGIIYSANQKKAVKKFEGNKLFLGDADFNLIDKEKMLSEIRNMSSQDFLDLVMMRANCADEQAAINWMKKWIQEEPRLSVKNGLVKVA